MRMSSEVLVIRINVDLLYDRHPHMVWHPRLDALPIRFGLYNNSNKELA